MEKLCALGYEEHVRVMFGLASSDVDKETGALLYGIGRHKQPFDDVLDVDNSRKVRDNASRRSKLRPKRKGGP